MFLFNRMKYFIDGKKVKKKYFDFNLKMKLMIAEDCCAIISSNDLEPIDIEKTSKALQKLDSSFHEKLKEIEINGSVKVLNSVYEIRR